MSENIKMFSALSVALHLTYSVTFSKVWCILGNPYGGFHWLTQFMLDYVFPRNSMDFIEWMLCYPEIPSRQGVSHKFHVFHWVTLFILPLRFSQTSGFHRVPWTLLGDIFHVTPKFPQKRSFPGISEISLCNTVHVIPEVLCILITDEAP